MGAGALALVSCALLLVSALGFSGQPQLAACGLLRSSGRATCTSGRSSYVKASELRWFGESWPPGGALFVISIPELDAPGWDQGRFGLFPVPCGHRTQRPPEYRAAAPPRRTQLSSHSCACVRSLIPEVDVISGPSAPSSLLHSGSRAPCGRLRSQIELSDQFIKPQRVEASEEGALREPSLDCDTASLRSSC